MENSSVNLEATLPNVLLYPEIVQKHTTKETIWTFWKRRIKIVEHEAKVSETVAPTEIDNAMLSLAKLHYAKLSKLSSAMLK